MTVHVKSDKNGGVLNDIYSVCGFLNRLERGCPLNSSSCSAGSVLTWGRADPSFLSRTMKRPSEVSLSNVVTTVAMPNSSVKWSVICDNS